MIKLFSKLTAALVSLFLFFFVSAGITPAFAALGIDVTATANQGSAANTIQSPLFSTSQPNEVLYAFLTSDGPSNTTIRFNTVTGAGLTWTLVRRVNTQRGTSEIWKATATAQLSNVRVTGTRNAGSYVGTVTVISFTGADLTATGTTGGGNGASGAPTANLTTTRNNALVLGVGNDWDNATARTVGPNQTMINQYLASVGDTFWLQRQSAVTPSTGTVVTINDTAPTNDRWNLAIAEVLPAEVTPTATPTIAPTATPTPTTAPTATPTPTNAPTPTPTSPPSNTNTPVLVVTNESNQFTKYYGEILKAEGLNAYQTADIESVTATTLANYDVVILGEMTLTPTQVTLFTDWTNGGGNLIAMKPDKQLAGLLGLNDANATLADKYLTVNTTSGPGVGIVGQSIQFHSAADLYTLNGATSIATLYSNATTTTSNPAVTMRTVGSNGGQAAAFTYDLAKSIVYTHQGNPDFAGQERDGDSTIRPHELFYPDYLDLNKVAIPQADEQQRLLANMITQMNLDNKPMPRFWYLPHGNKAAIVYTLDDHNTASGTKDVFNKFVTNSAVNCSVVDWECMRGTSWFFTGINLNDSEAAAYNTQGFEMGLHAQNNGCTNFTSLAELNGIFDTQLQQFQQQYPSLPAQNTHRFHCIVWSDWASQANANLAHNIRYNMDYYYWPASWIGNRPGLFTGSGIPMKFAEPNGTQINVYQGVSQLVNENGIGYDFAVTSLLANATGPNGYYGMFGTHDDYRDTTFSTSIVNAANSFDVPVISAKQALTWLDGRNGSSFSNFSWNGNTLNFTVTRANGSQGIQGMLPLVNASNSALDTITVNGSPVTFTTQTIKGIQYAFFPAAAGNYVATYNGTPPTPTATPTQSSEVSLWPNTIVPATPAANDPNAVEVGVKFSSDVAGQVKGFKFYKGPGNTGTHTGHLWTSTGTLLATATFSNETATGWQQVTLDTPVAITAGTTYVVSYHAPVGNYAAEAQYFATNYDNAPLHAPSSAASGGNAVYSYGPTGTFPTSTFNANNYWVDVIFQPGSGGPTNTPTPTPTVEPTATPTPTTAPTATPTPGASLTIWPSTVVPANPQDSDTNAVSLGVKFTSDVAGQIKGIRFYKGPNNTGTHIGSLWSNTGTRLATVTFNNETASGWQEALFSTPVTITAGTTYVASYFAPNGRYAGDNNYFSTAFDNGSLHALSSGSSGGNGVYTYGSDSFPTSTYQASNYWVDVVFQQ